jgi:HK97 family phage portal protein
VGFIQRLRKFFNLGVSDPKAWNPSLWNLYGAMTAAGEAVNEETALTYSAYWNAVSLISGTISSLPLHLMKVDGRSRMLADDMPAYRLMHDRWNDIITAKVGRQTITAHALTWGNGFAEKILNGYGETIELWPISPNRVVSIELVDTEMVYGINVDSEIKYLPRRKILHLHGMGNDGFVGYSVVAMARKSIGLSMAMETFGSNLFGTGTNPGAVVTHPGQVRDRKAMREAITDVYAGLGKSHRLMLLEEGMKYERIGIPAEDSQFLESRQFQIPEIARWFNLPPHKLKDLTKSSFNNIEQEQISFVTDSILPWLIDFEQEFNQQLLTERQKYQEKLYFKHIVEGLLRADAKSRAEFYQIMRRNGLMTPNEIRGKEDLNPHPDPLADELWTEVNMAPMSKLAEVQKKASGENPQALPDKVKNLVEFNTIMGSKK